MAGTASDLISSEIKTFSTAVFQGQAELVGMAAALAGYLDWMRKVPSGSSPPNTKPVFVNVLETLQGRLMELSELAQTKHQRAFREMIAALEKGDGEIMPLHVKDRVGPLCSMIASDLAGVEDDAVMRGREVYDFFQTKYNACAMLSEQTAKLCGSIDAKDSSA